MTERLTRCRPVLGTFVEVTGDCEAAIDAAFEAIGQVHRLMSAHEPESDISHINRFGHEWPVEIDPSTLAVLERALLWSRQSEGAFDILAAGAAAIECGSLLLHQRQPRPRAAHWIWLELCGTTAKLLRPSCIDVGGIAKGYAVDRAVLAMKEAGAKFGLVNAGGDIAGFGPQPWPVQVVYPQTRQALANVAVSNGAIATSSILPDGSASHVIGRDSNLISATVCAPNAIDADALTKIVLSGSPTALSCLEAVGAQALILRNDGTTAAIEPGRQAA